MSRQQWHGELADLAKLNAHTCFYKLDECRNTTQYHVVGQNLALLRIKYDSSRLWLINDMIEASFDTWLWHFEDEKMVKNAFHYKVLPSYQFNARIESQFSVTAEVLNDSIDRVGCATSELINNGEFSLYFVCNFNGDDSRSYDQGPPAGQCKTGTNPEYHSLCSKMENALTAK